ncbi:MAG: c-type cytochrome [Anaerolineales bacterium]
MNPAYKRLMFAGLFVFVALVFLGLWAYDVVKIDFISFMEIQPSFDVQEQPLPVPARSVPIEGPAFIPNMGAPTNPVPADDVSISRGQTLFSINCVMCHGSNGEGNGQLAALIANKPANLTSIITQSKTDGALFLTITNGVEGKMPPMVENLTVRDRWDVINYIRTLKPAAQ